MANHCYQHMFIGYVKQAFFSNHKNILYVSLFGCNSMKQSPFCKIYNRLAYQEIRRLYETRMFIIVLTRANKTFNSVHTHTHISLYQF